MLIRYANNKVSPMLVCLLVFVLTIPAQALIVYPDKVTLRTWCYPDGRKVTERIVETGGWEITKEQLTAVAGGIIVKLLFDPPGVYQPLFENISAPSGWSYSISPDGQMLTFESPTPITDEMLIDPFSFRSSVPFGYFDAGLVDTNGGMIEKIWWDEPEPEMNPYSDVLFSVVGTSDPNINQFFIYNDGNTALTGVQLSYVESGISHDLAIPDLATGDSYSSFTFDGELVTYAELTTNETLPTILQGSSGIPTYSCGNPIPEPATVLLLAFGGLSVFSRGRKR